MKIHHTLAKSVSATAAALLLLGTTVAAQAQTTPPAQPQAESAEKAFKRADANGDGKLSKAESARLPAIAERFEQVDQDKDGFLSMTEFMTALTAK
jgi:Ca2+-binding EF-hand superfamily protein